MLNLGGITAPPLFGLVVDATSYDVAWTLAAAVTAIGAVVVWTRVAQQS